MVEAVNIIQNSTQPFLFKFRDAKRNYQQNGRQRINEVALVEHSHTCYAATYVWNGKYRQPTIRIRNVSNC